jgi:ADP-heptose:LPS heptosyltransferase
LASRDSAAGAPAADRILIIRLGALGDVVRTLPAAVALRSLYPGAHLTWLVEPGAKGVVDASGVVDETLVFPRGELVEFFQAADGLSFARMLIGLVRRLRDRRFDLVLDFHGLLKSGLLARLSGAPIRYGFGRNAAREFADRFVNRPVELADPHVSRYDRNAALVEALDPGVQLPIRPFLQPSPLAVARLTARLRISNRDKAEGFVLIHPGSSPRAGHKRYAPSAWGEVAQRLAKNGIQVWVASGSSRDERNLVEEIIRTSEGASVPAPETRSFDDLLALLIRASVFVSRPTRFTMSPGPTPRPVECISLWPVVLVDVDVRRPPACVRYRLPSSPTRFAVFVKIAFGPGLQYQSTQNDPSGQANSRSLPELDRGRRDGDTGLARTS